MLYLYFTLTQNAFSSLPDVSLSHQTRMLSTSFDATSHSYISELSRFEITNLVAQKYLIGGDRDGSFSRCRHLYRS